MKKILILFISALTLLGCSNVNNGTQGGRNESTPTPIPHEDELPDINNDEINATLFDFELLADDTYQLSIKNKDYKGDIYIPETYEGKNITRIKEKGFYDCRNITSLTISKTIKEIGDQAFYAAQIGKSLNIPDNVTKIGVASFQQFSVEEITIGKGIVDIPNSAFASTPIKNLDLFGNIETVGQWSFSGCALLEKVSIGPKLKEIGYMTFTYDWSLVVFEVDKNNEYLYADKGLLYNKKNNDLLVVPALNDQTELIINDNVEVVKEFAITECNNLTSIKLGKNVKTIEQNAITQNRLLESVIFNDGLQNIGANAFMSCNKLKEVIIPNSISSIGEGCFNYCSKLEKVRLSNQLTEIKQGLFSNCKSINDIIIPKSVTEIGKNAFYNSAKELTYEGTKDEWNNINKDAEYTSSSMIIHCTDGDIKESIAI